IQHSHAVSRRGPGGNKRVCGLMRSQVSLSARRTDRADEAINARDVIAFRSEGVVRVETGMPRLRERLPELVRRACGQHLSLNALAQSGRNPDSTRARFGWIADPIRGAGHGA